MGPCEITIAIIAGLCIGFSMGTVGGGGAILAVPVLVYGLHQTPLQATTGSLIVVGVTAVLGALLAGRQGRLNLRQGLVFGATAIVGSSLGALVAGFVPQSILMGCFAALMTVTALAMVRRLRGTADEAPDPGERTGPVLLVALATLVGFLTGFLGVGGGFMIVPALTLVLGVTMRKASGTSLVVIAISCAVALVTRLSSAPKQVHPHWPSIALLTAIAAAGLLAGAAVARRANNRQLAIGFAVLVCAVAGYTLVRAVSALV